MKIPRGLLDPFVLFLLLYKQSVIKQECTPVLPRDTNMQLNAKTERTASTYGTHRGTN